MDSFAPPPGPPPPTVPEGWKAVYNDQYKEWFYVNLHTKASQWDKPTSPAVAPRPDGSAPAGPPPGYDHTSSQPTGPEKGAYSAGNTGNMTEDERLARKLQDEENSRAGGTTSRGANDSYYGTGSSGSQPSYGQDQQQSYGAQQAPSYNQQPQQSYPQNSGDKSKGSGGGLFGKIASKLGSSANNRPPQQQYGGGYGQQGYPPQQYGGGYPPQQPYGGGYGGGGYGGGYAQPPPRKSGGGMGMGGMALGAGAGLVGGALLMDAVEDHDQAEYQQGYDAGQDSNDYGGDDGGDFGGDDGGDF